MASVDLIGQRGETVSVTDLGQLQHYVNVRGYSIVTGTYADAVALLSGYANRPAAPSEVEAVADPSTPLGAALRAAFDARFVRPRRPRLAAVGDSIAALYSSLTGAAYLTSSRSALAWANAILNNRFDVIGPSATVQTFGGSGLKTTDLVAGGHYAATLAADVDGIFDEGGTNDVINNLLGADVAARRIAFWDQALALGRFVIAATIPPVGATYTAAQRTELREANRLMKAAAAARRGVYIFDWYPALVDPATGSANAALQVGDNLHPNGAGGSRGGKILADLLDKLLPANGATDGLPVDDFSSKVVMTNGFMAGTGGTAQGGITGSVPTGWIASTVGAGTAVLSKVARTDGMPGEWTQVVATAPAPTADGGQILAQDLTPGGRWAIGDTVYGACEIETDAAGWDFRCLQLTLLNFGASPGATALQDSSANRATNTVALYRPGRMVLVTPRVVIPAGTTRQQIITQWWGAGTFRVSRCNIIRA